MSATLTLIYGWFKKRPKEEMRGSGAQRAVVIMTLLAICRHWGAAKTPGCQFVHNNFFL